MVSYKDRKPVWYNPRSSKEFHSKPPKLLRKKCLYFGSYSEFNCYLILKELLPPYIDLKCQPYLYFGRTRWRIDFGLSTDECAGSLFLGNLLSSCMGKSLETPQEPQQVYLEYKGFKDPNFMKKQKLLSYFPRKDAVTILVASHTSSVTLGKDYYKPIVSIPSLKRNIKEAINGGH